MSEAVKQYLAENVRGLSAADTELIILKGNLKRLRKKQLLLHEGEVCYFKVFVITGLLRNYKTDDNGNEYTMKFAAENSWTTDPDSYNYQLPAEYNIEALEPSEVMLWNHADFEALRTAIPALSKYSERIITQNASMIQNRILMNISASAEKNYLDFIETFPNVFNRVPLHMVASYLGVSRETLTRIRQGLTVAAK